MSTNGVKFEDGVMIEKEELKDEVDDFKSEEVTLADVNDKDEAMKFLKSSHLVIDSSESMEYPKELSKKIDRRIMFVMCGAYFLQFIDKNALNLSAVLGIKTHLGSNANAFANLGTIFNASYIFAEPISSYLLQVCPTSTFLSCCIVAWGVIVACHAACTSYASLMVIRTLLGLFESALSPGLIIISSMYWNKTENLQRTGIWVACAGSSVIVGGLLSFAFQFADNALLEAWQIFFLVLGLITAVFGVVTYMVLPNNPTSAKFLSEREKILVLEHIRANQTGTETKTFKRQHLMELFFKDKHTWPLFLLTIVSMISTGALGTWSVTIINNLGYSSKVSALFQMPVGAAMIVVILGESYVCSLYGHRTVVFMCVSVLAVVGYAILFKTSNPVANLVAIYLNMGATGVIALLYSWNSANTAGHTKKLARNALTMVGFSIGSLIGPQLFRADEAPHYTTAKTTLLITSCLTIPLAGVVGVISKWENNKRDSQKPVSDLPPNYEFRDLTDMENPNFRYSY